MHTARRVELEKRAWRQHLEKAGPGELVKVCTELLYVVSMLSRSPRPVPGPSQLWAGLKAAGLVPVMARSYWLMPLMAGCDWLTLKLKFIHIVLPGCLHLAVSGEDVWPQSLSSLRPTVARPTACTGTRAHISSH